MANEYQSEVIQKRVRQKLGVEKIKLWLPPYTTEDGAKGENPTELIERYSCELELSSGDVGEALEALRLHAVQKLAAQRQFRTDGLATVKVKLAGHLPGQYQGKGPNLSIEIPLAVKGQDLKNQISKQVEVGVHQLKLICAGRVIKDDIVLSEQNVQNLSQMMAIVLSATEAEAQAADERASKVAKTREAAELLSAKEDGGEGDDKNYYLQIADQSGKIIDLPPEERQALALAMTLNEKGRAALKRKNYGEALLLLLEADKEFKRCRSSILDAVDNYAILCLDIVWCHLCLKNVDQLPDAEMRLKTCDDCFRRSYGPNLERLALVRGGTGMERALFMRLHLLQGVLHFHQHQPSDARMLLDRCQNELRALQVDEDLLTQVMAMGFSLQEARLGLRVCEGNIQLAVAHIMKRREEKEERKRKEEDDKKNKKLKQKLGKTASGNWVDITAYTTLKSMGFPSGAAAEALRQSNNDVALALQVLQEHPEYLSMADPEVQVITVTDAMISQVAALGFDTESARAALHNFSCNVQKAIEELLKVNGDVPLSWLEAVNSSSQSSSSEPSTSTSASTSESSSPTKSPDEVKKENDAIAEIIPDIPKDEDDHLDLTLEEEARFLQEYQARLESIL